MQKNTGTSSVWISSGRPSQGDALVQIREDSDEEDANDTRLLLPPSSDNYSSDNIIDNDSNASSEEKADEDDRQWWGPRLESSLCIRILACLAKNVRRRTSQILLPFRRSPPSFSSFSSYDFRWKRALVLLLIFIFSRVGVIESLCMLYGIAIAFFSEDFVQTWGHAKDLERWPSHPTKDILPASCHSHNDYWRPVPLFSALGAGCVSVEADVWLIGDDLYVAHTRSAVAPNRTLKSLYVDPLVDLLEKQNPTTKFHLFKDRPLQGVFDTDPSQTFVLLIDFKTNGAETLPYVVSRLSPLRDRGYLTYWNGNAVVNGPVTVVATGNAPFNLLTANSTYRDVFFDAPLDVMEDGVPEPLHRRRSVQDQGQGYSGMPSVVGLDTYNPSNSYYASVSFERSIGYPWHFHITSDQLRRIRAQINGAHRRGLKVRYWGTPSWPRNLRHYIWSVLEREGADVLNVDDLKGATSEDWRHKISDWWF